MKTAHFLQRKFLPILLCMAVLRMFFVPAYAGAELITNQNDLLSAISNAREGDVLLVGHIDFTAPTGIFNELMRVQLDKGLTIRSGLENEKAVFTNGSFLLRGSKVAGEQLQCTFENIVFDGAVDTNELTAEDWERPYDESVQDYTCDVPLKAQYAVSFEGTVNAVFSGCVFQNYMYEYGGAIWCRYGDYTDNPYYLDLYGDYSGCKLDITMIDCQFIDNAAQYAGGAIYLDGNRDNVLLRARGCRFENNRCALEDFGQGGGAIYAQYANLELTDCDLIGNQGNFDYGMKVEDGDRTRGGAIQVSNGSLELTDCVVADNAASLGGGLCLTNTSAVLDGCVLTENRAVNRIPSEQTGPMASVGLGGAMYVETEGAIAVSVYNSSIYQNRASNAYGGIYGFYNEDYAGLLSQGYGKFDFYFCTVAGNTCDTDYDYSDSNLWAWYSHPGDVWTIPYITASGCVLVEDSYQETFPRQEEPTAENNYNYYGSDNTLLSEPEQYGHLTSDRWQVPAEQAKLWLGDRYETLPDILYVGSNNTLAQDQPIPPQELPTESVPTEPLPTVTEPEVTKAILQSPGRLMLAPILGYLLIPMATAVLAAVLLKKRKKSEPVPESQTPAQPTIVMTRYTPEQIEQIIRTVPQTQRLTPRELEVFREMLMGKKQGEIGYELGISVPTVKDNARRIYDKFEVQNKNELFVKIQAMIQN